MRNEDEDESGGKTHTTPATRILIIATFCLFAKCNLHTAGHGKSKIITSNRIVKLARKTMNGKIS